MIRIKCSDTTFEKIGECIKYGKCPEEQDKNADYCSDECPYNICNIEFQSTDDDKIIIESDIEDVEIKVCIFNSPYNYLGCGQVKEGDDCSSCEFYCENIIIKNLLK